MIYKVGEYPVTPENSYFTCDGELVPVCQFADTEKGIVRFAAMSEGYGVYFDYQSEDYPILERRVGEIELRVAENASMFSIEIDAFISAGRFLKPFPYEITEGMKASPPLGKIRT